MFTSAVLDALNQVQPLENKFEQVKEELILLRIQPSAEKRHNLLQKFKANPELLFALQKREPHRPRDWAIISNWMLRPDTDVSVFDLVANYAPELLEDLLVLANAIIEEERELKKAKEEKVPSDWASAMAEIANAPRFWKVRWHEDPEMGFYDYNYCQSSLAEKLISYGCSARALELCLAHTNMSDKTSNYPWGSRTNALFLTLMQNINLPCLQVFIDRYEDQLAVIICQTDIGVQTELGGYSPLAVEYLLKHLRNSNTARFISTIWLERLMRAEQAYELSPAQFKVLLTLCQNGAQVHEPKLLEDTRKRSTYKIGVDASDRKRPVLTIANGQPQMGKSGLVDEHLSENERSYYWGIIGHYVLDNWSLAKSYLELAGKGGNFEALETLVAIHVSKNQLEQAQAVYPTFLENSTFALTVELCSYIFHEPREDATPDPFKAAIFPLAAEKIMTSIKNGFWGPVDIGSNRLPDLDANQSAALADLIAQPELPFAGSLEDRYKVALKVAVNAVLADRNPIPEEGCHPVVLHHFVLLYREKKQENEEKAVAEIDLRNPTALCLGLVRYHLEQNRKERAQSWLDIHNIMQPHNTLNLANFTRNESKKRRSEEELVKDKEPEEEKEGSEITSLETPIRRR